jgi:hypothetical protein
MKKPQITITVIKEDTGYSATATHADKHIFTEGETFDELKANILDAVNLSFEDLNFVYTIEEIKLTMDLQSFFDFYKVINAKALSARIGMNQSLLAQYISGSKKPSTLQRKRILNGVQQIGRELSEIQFLL